MTQFFSYFLLSSALLLSLASGQDDGPVPDCKCCLACQDAPQAIHPEPTVYPPECFTKCTYTVTKYTAAISKKCKCPPEAELEALRQSKARDDVDHSAEAEAAAVAAEQKPEHSQAPPAPSDHSQVSGMEETPISPDTVPVGDEDSVTRGRRSKPTEKKAVQGGPSEDESSVYNPEYSPAYEEYTEGVAKEATSGLRRKRQTLVTVDETSHEHSEVLKRMARSRRDPRGDTNTGCPDNPFKICKARPMEECEETPEAPECQPEVPNKHIGPCGRLGPGYLSAYGVNAKTEFRIIYRAKNLTYEVIFPSEIVDWENIDFDKYEKKRVTHIVRQKGGMDAIRKSTNFNNCNCEESAAFNADVKPVQQGPMGLPPQTPMAKEKRQIFF